MKHPRTTVIQELSRLLPYPSKLIRSDEKGDYIYTFVESNGKFIRTRAYIKRPIFLVPTESGEPWDNVDRCDVKGSIGRRLVYQHEMSEYNLKDAKNTAYVSVLHGLIYADRQPTESVKMHVLKKGGKVTITCYCKVKQI